MATPIPENRAIFTLADVARATGGSLRGGDGDAVVRGVTTDSRGGVAGKLFVALVGDKFDGHRFVDDAVKNGAAAVLVRRGEHAAGRVPVVEVDDTLSG